MTGQYLEDLLLRPQATEASYSFLEELLTTRIASKTLGSIPGKDSLVDLLNVFTKMLCRAGSGWIILKSRRISQKIIVDTLRCINEIDRDADQVLGSLIKLVGSSSVLIKCSQEQIVSEILRLLRLNSMPSVNIWRLVRSLLTVCQPGLIDLQLIISSAIANLAICRTGYEAASCMEVLSILIPSIRTNSQMLNTSVGLSRRAASVFSDDQEVGRLFREIINKSLKASNDPERLVAPVPIPTNTVLVHEVVQERVIPAVAHVEVHQTVVEEKIDQSSPRSSCPSLDL